MAKKYNISQEYYDKLLDTFLNLFRSGVDHMEEQRSDTELLTRMVTRFVELERWVDADYIRGILGQDPVGAPGVDEPIPGQEIGRTDRGLASVPFKDILLERDSALFERWVKARKLLEDQSPKLNIDLKPLNLIEDDTQDKRRNLDGPRIHGESVCSGST